MLNMYVMKQFKQITSKQERERERKESVNSGLTTTYIRSFQLRPKPA